MITNEYNQILVLDGQDASRKELCDMLREVGVNNDHLICATSIEQALEILETGRIGLVIVEASDAIRQQYSICSLLDVNPKVQVVVKAYIEELGPIKTAAVRVNGILAKPVRRSDVVFHLNTALRIRGLHKKLDDIIEALQPDGGVCDACTYK
jgi:CheY-like chemotaxis protein